MKVCKFGGTSLADAGQMRKVCEIVAADARRRIVVVSAPGKRHKDDTKVTDLLIRCAEARLAGGSGRPELQAVIDRFTVIARELKLPDSIAAEVAADLEARLADDTSHKARYMDGMKAAGEDNSARVFAAALRQAGHEAAYVNPRDAGLLLSDEYGNAQLLPESYENLARLRERPGITVFPGFFGFTRDGAIVTFSRGGSDVTGAILAAAVRADVYENFTDVDSVFAADPRLVPNPAPIAEVTFREMRELAYAGFSVLHEEAIIPVVRAGIPINIRNTNRPDAPGTRIVPERDYQGGGVVGIASDTQFCTLYLSKYLMNREIGFGRRVLQILEEEGISYEHTPSGIDNLSVILRERALTGGSEDRVLARLRAELAPDDIEIERGLAMIMLVGEGMRYTVGMAARATKALADAGVNIEMINQGSSEISMMFGVKDADRKRAVTALYKAFFGSKRAPRAKGGAA